jgi:hypothetical protein
VGARKLHPSFSLNRFSIEFPPKNLHGYQACGERIFPVPKHAKGIFQLCAVRKILSQCGLFSAGILPPLSIRSGLLCFERLGGWWGCSCCEINRRQMHFIGDSWTRCRHSRRRRDPRAPAKIATYARLQSGAVVLVARLPKLQALSVCEDRSIGRAGDGD